MRKDLSLQDRILENLVYVSLNLKDWRRPLKEARCFSEARVSMTSGDTQLCGCLLIGLDSATL